MRVTNYSDIFCFILIAIATDASTVNVHMLNVHMLVTFLHCKHLYTLCVTFLLHFLLSTVDAIIV